MPKVGMKPLRQTQLIEATLASVEAYGLAGTTINTISKLAGVSTGIISHYFGGKQGLLEATVRYLLKSLKTELVEALQKVDSSDPIVRLEAVVNVNFANIQVSSRGSRTWLAFWSQAKFSPELSKLQLVSERRLISNLKYSFRQLIPAEHVDAASHSTAAMIDGLWLRNALSDQPLSVETSTQYCIDYIHTVVKQYK